MSERTRAWMSKKQQLVQKEKEIKAELDALSTEVESNSKKIALIALAAGSVALIGYLGYRAFSKSENAPTLKVEKKPTAKPKRAFVSGLITERLISMGISFIAKKLEDSLNSGNAKS